MHICVIYYSFFLAKICSSSQQISTSRQEQAGIHEILPSCKKRGDKNYGRKLQRPICTVESRRYS